MKKFNLVIYMGIILFILNGCSIFPSPLSVDINYYDIGFPEKTINPEAGIIVMPFSGGIGTEPRMIFRGSSNKIQFDAYNRWCFSPAKLIQRYMSLAFDDNKISTVHFLVSGDILRFEGDLVNKTANLSLKVDIHSYQLNELISSEVYNVSIPVKEITATSYAEAMGKAMGKTIDKIAVQIKKSKGK